MAVLGATPSCGFNDRNAFAASPAHVEDSPSLDKAGKRRLIDGVAASLKQYYFDLRVAQITIAALLVHEKNGDDDSVTDSAVFADLLTRQMRDASHDMHLELDYSPQKLPEVTPTETSEDIEHHRKFVEQNKCFVRKVEILPNHIGYLKLDWFPEPSLCQPQIVSAMAALNTADLLIIDLRDNRGGFPEMVSLIASYLFNHPEYMYSPRESPNEQSWTRSPVAGNRLADKPVYILTSASTWSGAEQFCYDLKMLKRVALVGETTGGGAHAGVFHRIDDHFGMGIPEQKAINPFGDADWEAVGVEPDVKIKAADALETAETIAERRLQKKEVMRRECF